MNFLYRLSYYLFGFIIGMFFLMFFFSGKKNPVVIIYHLKELKNDLLKKQIIIPSHLKKEFIFLNDSILYSQISLSEIIFSESNVNEKDTCNTYRLELKESKKNYKMDIKNCPENIFLNYYNFN